MGGIFKAKRKTKIKLERAVKPSLREFKKELYEKT